MSTSAADNGRRKVVVAPSLAGRGGVNLVKIIPIWLGSAAVHGVFLLLFYFVVVSAGWGAIPPAVNTEVQNTTDVEDPQKEPDLTNPDIGPDDTVLTNFNNTRIEEVSVPGPVDPTAAVGVLNAPEAAPQTVPAPPGSGGGTGASPVLADAGGGAMWGSAGGMGGIANLGAFAGRSGATKTKMLQEGGGSNLSEAAVARGLEWLALHQASDGHWSLHEFHRHAREKPLPGGQTFTCNCEGRTVRRNDVAATAFALLPFLAGGQTHKPGGKAAQHDYSKTVAAGLHYLIGRQAKDAEGKDGYFGGDMYAHGLATIAMCEAYGLTSDPLLKGPAQRALNYIVYAQDPSGGGWRYAPRTPGDTSVTGWELMALKSGQMSGLSVPKLTLRKCEQFLDSVESTSKGGYRYTADREETITMTSVGLLCRQYLGVNPRNPGLLAGVKRLKANSPGRTNDLYYLYYATQVMHHMGGDAWQFWNLGPDGSGKGGIRDTLISKQDSGSNSRLQHQKGSWAPTGPHDAGRIMSTSLSLLCLEVYYRHLPLYRRDLGVVKDETKK
jgi:hypothetical protein